jgi:hypothetical protein
MLFNAMPNYSNLLLDNLRNSYFKSCIGYIKANISDYNYIFYWNKLKESHQKNIIKSNLPTKDGIVNRGFNFETQSFEGFSLKIVYYLINVKVLKTYANYCVDSFKRTFSFGFYYIRGVFFLLFIDACLTDDEPL